MVQAGARDHYQLPLALYEGGLLETLVTDMYWPVDRRWFGALANAGPFERFARSRFCPGLDSHYVHTPFRAAGAFALTHLLGENRLASFKDLTLSHVAGSRALRSHAALFVYSYYASEAFSAVGQRYPYRFIFQVHPHTQAVRQLLKDELELVPAATASLQSEYELALDDTAFQRLADEAHLANGWTVASSHTADRLAQEGIPRSAIHVVPYGVDAEAYPMRSRPPANDAPFTIIFLGSMIQRKGMSYLLDAVRLLGLRQVRLVLCGRGLVDQALLTQYNDVSMEIKVGLPRMELVRMIHTSDVMVFPSLVEGFAHVILEAMACGVPVITTPHTCGPDVILDGQDGFIVPIRDPTAIAAKLAWAIDHRAELAAMGARAAVRAREFTWLRFRAGIRDAYLNMLANAT